MVDKSRIIRGPKNEKLKNIPIDRSVVLRRTAPGRLRIGIPERSCHDLDNPGRAADRNADGNRDCDANRASDCDTDIHTRACELGAINFSN